MRHWRLTMYRGRQSILVMLACACGPAPAGPEPATGSTTQAATSTTSSTSESPTPTTGLVQTATAHGDDTSAGGQDFIPPPDGGPPMEECDTFAPECPPGQKCVPYYDPPGAGGAWNATKCVEATGDVGPGGSCTAPGGGVDGIDDCSAGTFCWELDEDDHGTCFAMCLHQGENFVCPSASTCALHGDGVVGICLPWCDPLSQDCPDEGHACVPFSDDEFTCFAVDQGQLNDPCDSLFDCEPGLFCLDIAAASSACTRQASGCCQPYCAYPDGPCPDPDQKCLQWPSPTVNQTPGYEDVGFCGLAP